MENYFGASPVGNVVAAAFAGNWFDRHRGIVQRSLLFQKKDRSLSPEA